MKRYLGTSLLLLFFVAICGFTGLQNGNGKGNGQENNGGGRDHGNAKKDHGPEKQHPGNGDQRDKGNSNPYDAPGNGKAKAKPDHPGKKDDHFSNGNGNGHVKMEHGKGKGKNSWWENDAVNWNLVNYTDRWRPGKGKKVTICHQAGNSHPVMITVSENALKAHLNHGDVIGDCNFDYGTWTPDYIDSRERVYTVYEESWERMSYGEALIRLAMEKLLGVRTDLTQNRSRYSAAEIARREDLAYELENNIGDLRGQVDVTQQQLSLVNIDVNL